MKKKIIMGLAIMATVVGLAFAVTRNWRVTATCYNCGGQGSTITTAETRKEAIVQGRFSAKSSCKHESGCKHRNNYDYDAFDVTDQCIIY